MADSKPSKTIKKTVKKAVRKKANVAAKTVAKKTKASPREKNKDNSPLTVTIFGGSGFVGRTLTHKLLALGHKVRVVCRKPDQDREKLPSHKNLELMYGDITSPSTLDLPLKGADVAINLVGVLFEKGMQTFDRVHVRGASNVAKACVKHKIPRLLHMSALGADAESPSLYARTKGEAEGEVKPLMKEATIMRPSVIFGPGDNFLNMFNTMATFSPILPLVGGGKTQFQPAYVDDVADAFIKAMGDSKTFGKTYSLGGPQAYTFKEILEFLLKVTGRKRWLMPLPFLLASAVGQVGQFLPKPPLTPDQVTLLKSDNVVPPRAPGFKSLGITPHAMEDMAPTYLGDE